MLPRQARDKHKGKLKKEYRFIAADDYEEPYFSREHLPLPPPALRASLCAGQQLNYYKRFRPSKHRLDLYNRSERTSFARHSYAQNRTFAKTGSGKT